MIVPEKSSRDSSSEISTTSTDFEDVQATL